MFEYRVTKYDPAFRDATGAYKRAEWTSVSDIGRSFNGLILTEEEYSRIESAYIATAVAFLSEAGVSIVSVADLENYAEAALDFEEGSPIDLEQAGHIARRVLREQFWCRLIAPSAFLHFGYDYYMFIGVPQACPNAERLAAQLGLFVEPFQSPYLEDRI